MSLSLGLPTTGGYPRSAPIVFPNHNVVPAFRAINALTASGGPGVERPEPLCGSKICGGDLG